MVIIVLKFFVLFFFLLFCISSLPIIGDIIKIHLCESCMPWESQLGEVSINSCVCVCARARIKWYGGMCV